MKHLRRYGAPKGRDSASDVMVAPEQSGAVAEADRIVSDSAAVHSRRRFIRDLSALAVGVSAAQWSPESNAQAAPEISRIRLVRAHGICIAPQYVAEALLRAEGFTAVEYVEYPADDAAPSTCAMLAADRADLSLDGVASIITSVDQGKPVLALAGLHLGCYELFATDRVRSIHDLRGKVVPINVVGGAQHTFLSSVLAYIGLDPRSDVKWEIHTSAESMRLLQAGKVDAFLAFPPEPQDLRARGVSRVILNTARDKPWSNYYCCALIANRAFAREHPIACKRATRAILKAADLCAQDPQRAAKIMVDGGFVSRYETALQTLNDVNYREWRTYDLESALRFHCVRLHEIGMIKSTPQQIIERGTDWRILNALRLELKA
jgi:NitT/TauT family transport system substrate-binding protein